MYKITVNNNIIDISDKINYVKKNQHVWINTTKDEAEAIAIKGTIYTQYEIEEIDAGTYIYNNQEQIHTIHENSIDIENATCEFSNDIEQRLADIENAICELAQEV